MVTKEQAQAANYFHYTGRHECTKTVGPRGGVTINITEVRASGRCKTWKTRPAHFRVPIKYGFYEHSYIDQDCAGDFHIPEECPLRKESA